MTNFDTPQKVLKKGLNFKHKTLPPAVQNCPNVFSVATFIPFSNVVTTVSFFLVFADVNFGGFNPGIGCDRDIRVISLAALLLAWLVEKDRFPSDLGLLKYKFTDLLNEVES